MNTHQLATDLKTLDNAPCDQPFNDLEQAALDRCMALERRLGKDEFQDACEGVSRYI